MENFSRIYSSIEEAIDELNDAITGNPLKPRTTPTAFEVKKEMIKTKRLLSECSIRLWWLNKLLDGSITEQEFLDQIKNKLHEFDNY